MRYCVKAGESFASQQFLIATREWGDVERQPFATEVTGGAEYNFEPEKTHTMGVWTRCYPLKGGFAVADSYWVYPHVMDCVLIYQL